MNDTQTKENYHVTPDNYKNKGKRNKKGNNCQCLAPKIMIRCKEEELKNRTSWDLSTSNTRGKYVLQSVSEDRVEEAKASYPDSVSVKDSRDSSPNGSEEVVEGVGDGGLQLQVEAPLPKHLGYKVVHLWGTSSVLGPISQYQVLMDSLYFKSQ